MRSGAGSWPGSSRSRVVKRGRIPLPWARSGYDLSMGRWRCTISPGPNGSRAGMGDSIVLGCGHTWGIWFNRGPVPGMRRGTACWGDRSRTDYGVRSHRSSIPSRVLPKSAGRCIAGMMETYDELKERVRREQQLAARLVSPRNAGPEGPHLGRASNPSVRVVDGVAQSMEPRTGIRAYTSRGLEAGRFATVSIFSGINGRTRRITQHFTLLLGV